MNMADRSKIFVVAVALAMNSSGRLRSLNTQLTVRLARTGE